MRHKLSVLILLGLFVAGCAQIPKESVELSATVGRDLATVYKAHRELAQVLFTRMRGDVNRFVDDVYAPFQIRNAMDRQAQLATSPNPDDQRKSLFLAITPRSNGMPRLSSRTRFSRVWARSCEKSGQT